MKILFYFICLLVSFSCTKYTEPDGGQVKFITTNNGVNKVNIFIKSTTQTIDLVEVKRDSASHEALNRVNTIILKDDPSVITAYNAANGTNYISLPAGTFTTEGPVQHVGDTWTVTIAPGERSAIIKIKINDASAINFRNKYALGLTIVSSNAGGKVSSLFGSASIILSPQNNYSGKYRVTGPLVDVTNPAVTNFLPYWDADLQAITVDSCVLYPLMSGIPAHPVTVNNVGNSGNFWGSFGMFVVFNPVTDSVRNMINYYGFSELGGSGPPLFSASNTRRAQLDNTGQSWFNPVTHDITVKYLMYQPSVVPGGPRVFFDELWKYLGP